MNKQVNALQKATKNKQEQTIARALTALDSMQKNNSPISFQSVAEFASVSKTWLYSNQELRHKIEQLRDKSGTPKRLTDLQILLQKKEAHIKELELQVKQQAEKLKQLKSQLEVVYGELYKKSSSDI
jgi:hypothetical protein